MADPPRAQGEGPRHQGRKPGWEDLSPDRSHWPIEDTTQGMKPRSRTRKGTSGTRAIPPFGKR